MGQEGLRPGTRRLLLVLLVVLAIPALTLAETALEYIRTLQGESPNTFWWMFQRFLIPWTLLAVCLPIPIVLARRFPFTRGRRLRTVAVHALGGTVFGTVHLFLDVLVARLWWHGPLPVIGGTLSLLSVYLLRDLFIYGTLVGTLLTIRDRRALRERQLQETRLEADLATARLAALQARLEPHFLFNTLNTAVMLIRDQRREEAVEVLVELSELLRAVVHDEPGREVSLAEEWRFLERYLALEQARFQERLTVELELEPAVDRVQVPFLILQPLVENAIRHGIARRAAPGWIRVSARREADRLRLTVADNGPGLWNGNQDGARVGITNVQARLHEWYGAAGQVTLERRDEATIATVTIPLNRTPVDGVQPEERR